MPAARRPVADRFWRKVQIGHWEECWPWQGFLEKNGYGRARNEDQRLEPAHRIAYRLSFGPIADGLEIDHTCRNRRCVNPSHLEPVSRQENCRRASVASRARTHCKRGHEFTPDNIYSHKGGRVCRACILTRPKCGWKAANDVHQVVSFGAKAN